MVDTNRARAQEIAAACGTRPLFDARELLGQVDAVTIAVPTELHREVADVFLSAGIPVLVEKPMARSLEEADQMIEAAADAGVVLAVGQTERFNPALAAARPLITDPRFIEVHRLGTFPERSLDIDVVFDLMIHDLDVVLSLVDSDVESLEAVGVPVITNRVDIANARLRFANGCIANLTASRISRDRVRKIRFFQPSSYVSIDYAAQKVERWSLETGSGAAPSIQGGEIVVVVEEPLKLELADFAEAIAPFAGCRASPAKRAAAPSRSRRRSPIRWPRQREKLALELQRNTKDTKVRSILVFLCVLRVTLCSYWRVTLTCIPISTTSSPTSTSGGCSRASRRR